MPSLSPTARPQRVRGWTVAAILAALVGTVGVGLNASAQAAADAYAAEILSDGVDRSRLPRDQAVALAELSNRQNPVLPPKEERQHSHHADHDGADHMTPSEEKELERQLDEARAAVPKYDTVEGAEAAGYRQASGEADGAGAHWVNWEMVDEPFDPARPSMLLFDELWFGEGLELIAFSYWVISDDAPEGFAGEMDRWHQHRGLCVKNAWVRDENITREQCEGDWFNGEDLWMLHTWVVPGVENKLGPFAVVNPKLCERACGLEN